MKLAVAARATLASLAVLASGCPDRGLSEVGIVPSGVSTKDIPVSADLDILFVIDNSKSTQDKQTVFAENYPKFVTALQQFPSGQPNLHLGVVTTSVDLGVDVNSPACHPATGQDGILQNASRDPLFACPQPTTDRFLSDIGAPGGTREVNYTGKLEDALSCISHVGDAGCGFESPLEAIKRALDGRHPENAGFLRPGAFLAVVILTDEDDCSAQPALFRQPASSVGADDLRCGQAAYRCDQAISPRAAGAYTGCTVRHDGLLTSPTEYAQFLTGLKGSAGVAVAVIAGDPASSLGVGPLAMPFSQALAVLPSCSATINGNFAIGRPALRLDELLETFGDRGLFRTICQSDYSGALADIGALLFKAISPCIEGVLDMRDGQPDNPGLQPDCTVTDLETSLETAGDAAPVETVIPACHMIAEGQPDLQGKRACWWLGNNPGTCRTETALELHVERAAQPAPNTKVRVNCSLVAP